MAITDFGADLRSWIASQPALGLVSGTSLFRGQFPQDVIEGVLLIQTGGDPSDRPTGSLVVTVQITCRYRDLDAALTKARALYDLVNEPPSQRKMGSSKVIYSKAIQPPFTLGQDERQAWRVLFNAEFRLALS